VKTFDESSSRRPAFGGSVDGALVRRNRTSGVIGVVSLVALLVAGVIASFVRTENAFLMASYAIWPAFIAFAHHFGWLRAKTTPARLEVSSGSVSIDGAKRHVTRARVIPQAPGQPTVVQIGRRFDPYPARVALPTLDDARAFVRELGLDPREGVTRFRGPMSEGMLTALIVLALVVGCVAWAAFGPFATILGAVIPFVLERLVIPTITIGRDGILIERFFRKTFLPWARVVALDREVRTDWGGTLMVSRGFQVLLDSGEAWFIDTTRERMRDHMFQGDHLFDAAREAHALARSGQPRAADVLARGARPMKEWLAQLDGTREARYRVAAFSDEELTKVLANPSAEKTARVGAAICLARAGEDARVQVRVAVEDIAAPDVRAAALAALDGDEEALAEALESLE
jgi:hypothetical protein